MIAAPESRKPLVTIEMVAELNAYDISELCDATEEAIDDLVARKYSDVFITSRSSAKQQRSSLPSSVVEKVNAFEARAKIYIYMKCPSSWITPVTVVVLNARVLNE